MRYALEPIFERLGPDATPDQILDLKVCDPAMGSGAFLVEACRAIAAKLVKSWERWPDKKPGIPVDEDEDLHARRVVAPRCLYGVDKNPLATDLAKLYAHQMSAAFACCGLPDPPGMWRNATLPKVAEPDGWYVEVPPGAPPGQALMINMGCGQCHGPTFNGPRANMGLSGMNFDYFANLVYNHTTAMPQRI